MPTVIPVTYNFFGPAQLQAALSEVHGPTWITPGSAFSASGEAFDFNLNHAAVGYAIFNVIWLTHNSLSKARMINFTGGDASTIAQVGDTIIGTGRGGPDPQGIEVTSQMRVLRDAGVQKYFSFQTQDDGVLANAWVLYKVCLHIDWVV